MTVIMRHLEMGQGSHTGMATLIAEELDANWDQIQYQAAPANTKLYNNLLWGPMQGTGGSTAMANAYMQMRKAGATARHMLVVAAAQQWQVNASDIAVKNGRVSHAPSNRSASFGELAEPATQQPVPADVFLKEPAECTLIGRNIHRKDSHGKTNGEAIYTQDIKLPDMLTALVAHPPRFGAAVKSFNATAKQDPVDYRRTLMKGHPRHLGVMELAANKAGWNKSLTKGHGRGIAVHESFNSYVAQVAEVSVNDDKSFSVDRVVVAVDCGIAVNPDVIRAQMEGGMGFGLAAALSSKITLKDGKVQQSNFHDYTVLRMNQMPAVEVHIVTSAEPPTGVGEPATPVIAPAVANALFAATGQRFYRLPLQLTG